MSSSSVASARASQLVSHLTGSPSGASSQPAVSIVSRAQGVAVIQINNPPVNSLHPRVQAGIGACYEDACADPSIKAVVITGAKAVFMAGADIEYVHSQQNEANASVTGIRDFINAGNKIFNALESGPKPVVAAVNGTALGGGCELAMACNARIATDNAVFGQPELNLGIIPGLGGTQRFPRLIGLQTAVQATMTGKTIKSKDALKLGLIDAIVKPDQLLLTAGKLALDIAAGKVPRRKASQLTDKIGTYEFGKSVIEVARAGALKKSRAVPHPFAYLDAVEEGLKNGFDAGLEKEADLMSKLVMTPSSKALIHYFFATRGTTKGLPTKPTGKPIQRVAVLGGGTMGAGICIVYLLAGYDVILKEINDKLLQAGVERIINDLKRVAKARRIPPMMITQLMLRLTPQSTYDGFDKVDLVVEAVIENLQLKQKIFAELEKLCSKTAVLATNTSTIDIDEIGKLTTCKDRIIGLHFFSPAHIMPLLEIIRTKSTSDNSIALSLQMSKRIGKVPVVVGNCVGFVANRAFFPYGQSAGMLVDAGADASKIDRAIEKIVGMPMGIFRMADLSGIDIGKLVKPVYAAAYGSRCYFSPAMDKLVAAGRLGQKTGAGYYKYVKGKPVVDPTIQPLIDAARAEATQKPSVDASKLTDEQLVEAIFFPVVNEALRIVDEGFALRESDVDVVSITGYGFPAWQGGLLHWAKEHPKGGYKYVRDRLAAMSQEFGKNNPLVTAFYEPSALLNKKAAGQ